MIDERRGKPVETGASQKRTRLVGLGGIVLIASAAFALLAALFPRERLHRLFEQDEGTSLLSERLLNNLAKSGEKQDHPTLHLRQIERLIILGRLEEASQGIEALARRDDPALRLPLAKLTVRLREQAYYGLPDRHPAKKVALHAWHEALERLADLELTDRERVELAAKAEAAGAKALALRIYRALEQDTSAPEREVWLEKAAHVALGQGDYREAAKIYFKLRELARDREAQRRYYLEGVKALQSGNLVAEALAQGETHLGSLEQDREALIFLIRVALAANRPDRAAFYAKKLLRFAQLGGVVRAAFQEGIAVRLMPATYVLPGRLRPRLTSDAPQLSTSLSRCISVSQRVCWQRLPGVPDREAVPQLIRIAATQPAFDEEAYTLAYTAFLGNRQLNDAYAVAAAAVRHRPGDRTWRERLAQVAEWSGKPVEALEHWRWLATHTDSEAAWKAVLRLAPGLFAYDTFLDALEREARRTGIEGERLERFLKTYEGAGETERGIAFFESLHAVQPRREYLAARAWLEERMGRVDQALATYERLKAQHGLNPEEARRVAVLYITQNRISDAYQLLLAHNTPAAKEDVAYQKLLGELAWIQQAYAQAYETYHVLYQLKRLAPHEADRLFNLLVERDKEAAVQLAIATWKETHDSRYLMRALDLFVQLNDPIASRRLIATVDQETLGELSRQPSFLKLRATLFRMEGRLDLALAYLERAFKFDPNDLDAAANLLWALVESKAREPLKMWLEERLKPQAETEAVLWGPIGAAYVLLGNPKQALPYFAKVAAQHQDDYLWQIGYAQVLEEAGQAEMAWRVRRYAWLMLRRDGLPSRPERERLMGIAQLALRLAPGEEGAQWLREVLSLSAEEPSLEAKELVAAWFLSHEQYDLARLWLLQQYGRQLKAPGWTEALVALAHNDREKLAEIANGTFADVPPENRVEAAQALEEHALARRLAHAGLEEKPESDTLHWQLIQSRWQQGNYVGMGFEPSRLGEVEHRSWHGFVQYLLDSRTRVRLDATSDSLSRIGSERLVAVPGTDRELKLTLTHRHPHPYGETSLSLEGRRALDSAAGIRLSHKLRQHRRLGITASLGLNQRADESDALSVGAMRHEARLDFEWLISKRDYLLTDFLAGRYLGQDSRLIGSGGWLTFQLGHHLRTEYPDFTVKLLGGLYRFSENTQHTSRAYSLVKPGLSLLPGDSNQIGIGLGVGETVVEDFSRDFRPYATVDFLYNDAGSWDYGFETGFVVSPLGDDWLRFRLRRGSNLQSGQDTQSIGLEYRYLW